jgi:Flp pilus assembly protein TadG
MTRAGLNRGLRGQPHRALRALAIGRGGHTALEFAAVSLPFIFFLMFLFEIGIDFYFQLALDYTLKEAARQVATGAVPGGVSSANFKSSYVCPFANGLLNCSQIYIQLQPVPVNSSCSAANNSTSFGNYYCANVPPFTLTSGSVATDGVTCGQSDGLMLLQAIYLSPSVVGSLPFMISPHSTPSYSITTSTGLTHVTVSQIGFVNEPGSSC